MLLLFALVWGVVFLYALLPGTFVGWLIGKISVPTFGCVAFAASLALLVGLFFASSIFGGLSTTHHGGYAPLTLALVVPPILLPMLIGIWISRAKVRTNPRSQ
jgi:hypothetical protein